MNNEQIQKLAMDWFQVANKKDIRFDLGWVKIFEAGLIEGYKAAMLQGMEEISMLKKQLSEQRASAVMNEQGLLELNRNIYETSIDDLLSWLKNNHYLPQTEETIQKITDQFYKEKNIKPMLQNKGEWISVKERLPEFNKNVLALSKNGVIAISCVDSAGKLDDFELEISNGDYYTHWQPLPTPPKQTVTQ